MKKTATAFSVSRPRRGNGAGRLLAMGAVSLALASALATAAPESPPPPKLTFIHWWTAPSEAAAINALVKMFNEKYPDATVFPTVAPSAGNMRILVSLITKLEAEKHPPDAF